MVESIRNILSPTKREDKRLAKEASSITYRLSVMTAETIEEQGRILKKRGLDVEIDQGSKHCLIILPLSPIIEGLESFRIYLNPALNMTYVRRVRKDWPEEVKGDMSELEYQIRSDLLHLRDIYVKEKAGFSFKIKS